MKSELYIDIDDTIIAECYGVGFDLRPAIMTQLRILGRMFNCNWLTHWDQERVTELMERLYGGRILKEFVYCNWKRFDPRDKAVAVLKGPRDFYWLEDPLSTGELHHLEAAGLLNRYIPVDPKGPFGFTRAVQKLFCLANIKKADIVGANGDPSWFQEPLGDHFDWTYYE